MARIPVATDLGRVSSRSGRGTARQNTTAEGLGVVSIGRGIQDVGQGVQAFAESMQKRQTTLDIAKADAAFNSGAIEIGNAFDQDGDYATYGDRAAAMYSDRVQEIAAGISDPRARELWVLAAQSKAASQTDTLRDQGIRLQEQAAVVSLEDSIRVNYQIATDPSVPEEIRTKARADMAGAIEVATGVMLDPSQAAKFADQYLRGADTALAANQANLEIVQDPERVMRDLGIPESREDYFRSIRAAESGGNDAADNPNSTALGRYQFLESTWKGLVERYPNSGLTANGRLDPRQQEIAIRLFTDENAAVLERSGIAPTNGNLYAAHFLGSDGAAKVLTAPGNASLAGYVEPRVIDANPFLRGMTVSQFKAWAAKKGGGRASEPAERFASLPFDDRLVLYEQAQNQAAQQRTASAAQQDVAFDVARERVEAGILQGSVASEGQIWGNPNLRPEDQNTLVRSLRAEQEATAEARAYLAGLGEGTAPPLNPYSSDDRSLADKAYAVLTEAVPEEQRAAATVMFVQDSGIVPKPVVASVRQSLNSTDPAAVQAGLQQSAALLDAAPGALDNVEHGKELREAAATYNELVNNQGFSAEQAAQRVIEMRDPANVARGEMLDTAWDEVVKDDRFVVGDVLGAFDRGWFGGGTPSAGMTPAQKAGLTADYLDAAERAFKGPAQGDPSIARAMALEEMKRIYGVSQTSGSPVVMKFPPENFYPAVDGSQDYIRALALKDAKDIEPEAANVMLVPTPETSQDVRAGDPPRYNLMYQLPDGRWDMASGLFMVDTTSIEALNDLASDERAIRFEMERRFRERLETRQPGQQTVFEVFDGSDIELSRQLLDVQLRRRALFGQNAQGATVLTEEQMDPRAAAMEAERLWLEQNAETFGMFGSSGGSQ